MDETTKTAGENAQPPREDTSATAQAALEEGERLANAGQYDEAIAQYQKAVELNSHLAVAYANWGLSLAKKQQFREAIEKFKKGIDLQPVFPEAYRVWGNSLSSLKDYDAAIAMFQKCIEQQPGNAKAYFGWGLALGEKGENRGAIEMYKKAVELQPDMAIAYLNWGINLSTLNDYDGAIAQYKQALEHEPRPAAIYLNWGITLARAGRYGESLEKYAKATELAPGNAATYLDWAISLANLNRYEEAIELCRKSIDIDPHQPLARLSWGVSLANLGRYPEAIEQYEKAVALQEDYAQAYLNWGISLSNLNQHEAAIKQYQKAIEHKGDVGLASLNWGVSLANLKRFEEAARKYEKAVALNTNLPVAYFNWGVALAELRRYDDAIEKYRSASEADPGYAYSGHNIGFLYWKKGQFALARKEWRATRDVYAAGQAGMAKSRNADYFQYFGDMLRAIPADWNETLAVFDEGLSLAPEHVGILSGLAGHYLEKWQDGGDVSQYWKGRQAFKHAEALLKDKLKERQSASDLLRLGRLCLGAGEMDDAENYLLQALKADSEIADAQADLGAVKLRAGETDAALRYFEAALRRDPDNLAYRSSFADACAKAGRLDQAESEYKKVLRIAPLHLESVLGLGKCYLDMAETGDDELYDEAVALFIKALAAANSDEASRRLKPKDLTALYYSIGYTKVKQSERSKTAVDESLLQSAKKFFEKSFAADPSHLRADRAAKAIGSRMKRLSSEWFTRKVGPAIIFVASLIVFVSAATGFFLGKPRPLNEGAFSLLGFSSLLFMVAGLSLPQLLKLKVGGIELEKGAGEISALATPLGIKKDQESFLPPVRM